MPTTRSQSQLASQRKTRANRKRVKAVVTNDPVSFDFGVHDQATLEDADLAKVVEQEKITKKVKWESSSSETGSSARTRPYYSPAAAEEREEVVGVQVSSKKKKDQINGGEQVDSSGTDDQVPLSSKAKTGIFKDKSSTPIAEATATITPTTEKPNTTELDGSGSEKAMNDGNVTVIPKRKEKSAGFVKKVPRYVLEPNAFQENPAERERILKSIYDRKRREREMKDKVGKLKQENIQLKKMLLFAMASKTPAKGGVYVSLKPGTIITTRPSVTSFQNSTAGKERPISTKTAMSLPLCPPTLPSSPKEQHLIICDQHPTIQHEQTRVTEDLLAKEKESINKLYKQLDVDEDEDMEFHWAAIQGGPTPSDCVETQLGKGPDPVISADRAGKSKRKQTMTSRKVKDQNANKETEDDIQILKEIKKSVENAFYPSSEKYPNLIFENI